MRCGPSAATPADLPISHPSFLPTSPTLHPPLMKITELVVGPGGFKLQINDEAPNYWLQTDYERIEERCWGGLSPDSPVPGLCTDLVDTCFVFVFRCVASGRTTLCHAVSETDPAAFDAQMRYAAGDDARGQVEIVVFKGRTYGEPGDIPPEILRDDLRWVSKTLARIRSKTPSCTTSVHPQPLRYGVILIEKSSGDLILPIPPNGANRPDFLHCCASTPTPTTLATREVYDAFYRIQSTSSYLASNRRSIPCFEVYDGTRRLGLPPPSARTREIFRIAAMQPNFPSMEAIQQSDLDICQHVAPTREMVGYVEELSKLIQTVGAPCEVEGCRKLTTQKCAKCKGAHYCSRAHQTENWAEHKAWCKSHRYTRGGLKHCGDPVRLARLKWSEKTILWMIAFFLCILAWKESGIIFSL
ncbi:hypothetical protein DFH06DRAFT_345051 [Mycena polygramma]|nr:hypothetical protein DFH06DRAFT_345051 [Mycena polygramma]